MRMTVGPAIMRCPGEVLRLQGVPGIPQEDGVGEAFGP